MTWVRIDTGAKTDPKFGRLAKSLRIRQREVVGLFVAVLLELPTHARDGDISDVGDETLETWAGWHGKPGQFAAAFRAEFMRGNVVRGWEKHNGAAIRQSDAEAERKRLLRLKSENVPPDGNRTATGHPPAVPPDGNRMAGCHPPAVPPDGGLPSKVRDVTGRDGTSAVAVFPCDSKKQLHQLPSGRTARARAADPRTIGAVARAIVGKIESGRVS